MSLLRSGVIKQHKHFFASHQNLLTFRVMLLTDKQTNQPTDKYITFLAEVITADTANRQADKPTN